MFMESLTPGPELENDQDPYQTVVPTTRGNAVFPTIAKPQTALGALATAANEASGQASETSAK